MSRKAVRVRLSALCTLCTDTKKSRQESLDLALSLKEANASTTTSRSMHNYKQPAGLKFRALISEGVERLELTRT
jgi:hypothetical protein